MVSLIVDGAGALGKALIDQIRLESPTSVIISVDLFESPHASKSFIVSDDQSQNVTGIEALCTTTLEDVYCVAGGWEADCVASPDIFDVSKRMWKVNVEPALLAAHLAAVLNAPIVVFIGANAALHGTPGMVSYGCAKAALIHLVASLNDKPSSGMVLDTPANREAMPKADFSRWTPLGELASYIYGLKSAPEDAPSKIVVSTHDGETTFKSVD